MKKRRRPIRTSVLTAVKGEHSLPYLVERGGVHPRQVSQCRKDLLLRALTVPVLARVMKHAVLRRCRACTRGLGTRARIVAARGSKCLRRSEPGSDR